MSIPTSQKLESSSSSYSPQPCRQFTLSEIEVATRNFDESLVLGRGGFGKVYKGTITLGETNLDAAIKRLESGSSQGAVEFWAEIEMLSNLRHYHLVSLIGYYSDGQEMILVYEYMPNGTLADHLHKRQLPLTWVRRLKICIGAARGLDYLHGDTDIKPIVIHRDVKSSNILLDDNWAAKISDFGLSKIGPANQPSTYVNTLVRGTFGYMDPDYFHTGRLTRKSDVYAFGVVLFEVLCGKQAVDRSIDEEQWGLATWAQDSIEEGRLEQSVDVNLKRRISPKCLKEFALLANRCLHSRPKKRPTMAEVVVSLESILALEEKTYTTPLHKFFGRRVWTSFIPSNKKKSAGRISLKSMDQHLYTVGGEDPIVYRFDFNTIVYATDNFSESSKLKLEYMLEPDAEYSMYKGRLQNGHDITVTRLTGARINEKRMNEALVLIKLKHENVIQLLGYCIDGTSVYFIYDLALNTTLDRLLFDPVCNLLDWNKRYKIIQGVARALEYIHYHASNVIIHRDVRPANILLDGSFDPKLTGFGLARAVDQIDDIHSTRFVGNLGYTAPEYAIHGHMSAKLDVYSFGVVVLETITGQRMSDKIPDKDLFYMEYVWNSWWDGTLSNVIVPRIGVDPILMTKVIEIGLLCLQMPAALRPTMKEVVDMLLSTSPTTLRVSEMRARMINDEPPDSQPDSNSGWLPIEDYDTNAVEEFISELCPR